MLKQIKDDGCMFSSTLAAIQEIEDPELQPTLIRLPRKYFVRLGAHVEDSRFLFGIPVECHETKFEFEYHKVFSIVAQLGVDLILDPTENFIIENGFLKTKISLDAFREDFDTDTLLRATNYAIQRPVLVLTDGNCYTIDRVRVCEDIASRTLCYEMSFDRNCILDTKYLPSLGRALAQDPDGNSVMHPELVRKWIKEAQNPEYVDVKRILKKSKGKLTNIKL